MEKQAIAAVLVFCCIGGLLYAFVYPYLSGDIKGQKRQAALVSTVSSTRASAKALDQAKRRKAIADSLNEVEGKKRKVDLEQRIQQAGLEMSKKAFFMVAAGSGMALGLGALTFASNPLVAGGAFVVGAFGLPNWVLRYLQKRRIGKFIEEFPGAIDVIVRGIKAGLPLGDCLRVVANEGNEPVCSEFRKVVEAQAVGLTMPEAIDKLSLRVPVSEVAFFSIVINLQQKAGGNLSEALSNLSNVLRDRKKMKAKVKAVSSEARSSAMIIGSLPFLVGGAVQFMNPTYLSVLFTTTFGNIILAGAALWMSIGIFVMYQMMSFEI